MAANVIDSFLIALGFQTDTSGAEDYKKSLEGVEKTLATVAGVATAAAGLIGWAVHKAAQSMGEIWDFAELNEISARSVQALIKVGEENDVTMEGMKSTIQSLNKVIGEAALGIGRGAMTFEKLGLSAKKADGSVKSVDDMLGEVADKMQGLSRQEQLALGMKLGIDPQFVKTLAQGSENLAKLREEAEAFNPFKEEDYELADQVDKLYTKASKTVGVFGKQIAVSLFPVIKQMLEGYLAWFKEFRKTGSEAFSKALKAIVSVLQTLWEWVVRVVTVVKDIIHWFTQFEIVTWAAYAALLAFVSVKTYTFVQSLISGLIGLTRTMLGFNAAALIWPAIIGAIILAVALLIDEFVNFKEGNDSFLGDLVKEYPQLLGVINSISDGISAVIDWVMNLFSQVKEPLTNLGKAFIDLFMALWPVVKFVFTIIGAVIMAVLPVVLWLAEKIVGLITWAIETAVAVVGWLVNAVAWVVEAIAAYVKFVTDFWVAAFNLAVGAITTALNFLVGIFTGAWEAIRASFTSVFDWMSQKFDAVVGKVKDAISWVGNLIGLSDTAAVKVAAANAGNVGSVGYSPSSATPASGALGVAAGPSMNSSSVTTQTTTVNVPQIVVNSPDPAKAGQSVREELERMNRQTTRNGQSAVLL